ncbi:MAG: alanine dehydrogenase [Candidatus Bathyarchaeia archaeon]
MKILLLTYRDLQGILTPRMVLKAVEEAFREKGLGRVQMPPKVYLYFRRHEGDLRVMPSYLESLEASGVKVVNVHPNNPKLHGLPTVMAVMILVNPRTGEPYAIMDGTLITAYRTGAAAAVATKYLARNGSSTLGLVGAGVQSRSQLVSLREVVDVKLVKVYDADESRVREFVEEMAGLVDFQVHPSRSVEECVSRSDIVCTTTPSRAPLVKDKWIQEGTHINAIGADAPGKQELDPDILRRAKIVVDDLEQASHSGEINVPLSQGFISLQDVYGELSEIVCGFKDGRVDEDEVTVFDSTGLSIQDVATAVAAYEMALKKNVGTRVEF